MSWQKFGIAVGILLVIAAGIGEWRLIKAHAPDSADADHPELVALGERIYGEHCAACHGENLEGQPNWRQRDAEGFLPAPPHDATGHTWHHSDDVLFEITKDGTAAIAPDGYKTNMVGFGDLLSDTEIWGVLAFIKSRWPQQERDYQARLNETTAR